MSRRLILALLLALPFAAFSGVLGNGFVNFDDQDFVTENAHVSGGLNGNSVHWAFTGTQHGHWMPLTMLSHMFDVEFFGMDPRGHHLTSLLLHALNTALMFLALARLTGSRTRAALAAALFAVHPLQVESVAWISQRRNLLCGLFFWLTLWRYAAWTARLEASEKWKVGACMALTFLSKSTAVFLPFLLLVLDFWPLKRIGKIPARKLVLEKLPFFALAALFGTISLLFSPLQTMERVPFSLRAFNAAVSCWRYLFKFVWPADLAVFYPYPDPGILRAWAAPAILGLGLMTAAAAAARKREPAVIAGWLWFVVLLFPVLGLVQVGGQSMADRYAYLPLAGLAVVFVWGGSVLLAGRKTVTAAIFIAALFSLAAATARQVTHWQDGVTLFRHAATVTERNGLAHQMLGLALLKRGELAQAESELRKSLELQTVRSAPEVLGQLGFALAIQGRKEEARAYLLESLRLDPEGAKSRHNLMLLQGVLSQPSVTQAEKNSPKK